MGLFDNLSAAFDKGVSEASRVAEGASLKMKLVDIDRNRKEALAKFAEGILADENLCAAARVARPELFETIDQLDAEKAKVQEEIDRREAEAAAKEAEKNAASVFSSCPNCGEAVSAAARFCPNCGAPFESAGR